MRVPPQATVYLRQAYVHVAQAGLELLGSRDPPTSDPLEPGAIAMVPWCHDTPTLKLTNLLQAC